MGRQLGKEKSKRKTENSATVMDKSLLKTLEQAERASSYTPFLAGNFTEPSTYDAGAWTDFVMLAGM